MNKKSILIIVLILAVIIAVVALSFGKGGEQTPAEETETTTVNATEPNVEDPATATEDTLPEGWVEDGDDETLPPIETVTPTETTATEATDPEEIVLEEDDPDEVVLEEDAPKEETVPPTTQGGAAEVPGMTYAQYMAMSAAEQRAYMESFPTVDDFFAWFNAAKEAHESGSSIIIDGSNSVDMGEIAGKK